MSQPISSATDSPSPSPSAPVVPPPSLTAPGIRKNGKQWHLSKSAFRPGTKATSRSYAQRALQRQAMAATKAKEREMKEEKEAERQRRNQAIKDRRTAKADKERYEQLAVKMHRKRVERLKRREKRNKLLKS